MNTHQKYSGMLNIETPFVRIPSYSMQPIWLLMILLPMERCRKVTGEFYANEVERKIVKKQTEGLIKKITGFIARISAQR